MLPMRFLLLLILILSSIVAAAEPDFPLTPDSKPQDVPKGELIKGSYTARDGSVFPGTEREYQIYLPAGHDKSKPAAFMVFQDGVIYQAPVVFDNLIARKEIPPLVGIFIKPGVVPAANENALPRFNRSYEYDSITPTYSRFLIDEFLPAIESKHSLKLSTDPNHAAISGNSSGGICAFMVAWHRPDRFRRVFTGVGTYVGIHGADQLPVLVRKFEPKPLRIFLQSGTGDNNLYCGDWWMANQMMERSLTWAGYDVNHAWGESGHNAKHATQIFPAVLRWLWRDWQTTMEIKANPKGQSKWKGYEVVGAGEWEQMKKPKEFRGNVDSIAATASGELLFVGDESKVFRLSLHGSVSEAFSTGGKPMSATAGPGESVYATVLIESDKADRMEMWRYSSDGKSARLFTTALSWGLAVTHQGDAYTVVVNETGSELILVTLDGSTKHMGFTSPAKPCLSPDQTQLYVHEGHSMRGIDASMIQAWTLHGLPKAQSLYQLEDDGDRAMTQTRGLCVDTNGWLYVATAIGIQVCDQAGRVNFILPTPKPALDVCFGGKDLSELFIACGDTIYKRPTKAKGIVSGQQPPIKPPAPKL